MDSLSERLSKLAGRVDLKQDRTYIEFDGFEKNLALNGKCFRNDTRLANERETYWPPNEAYFLYFRKTQDWMIDLGSLFEQIRGGTLSEEEGFVHNAGAKMAKSKW